MCCVCVCLQCEVGPAAGRRSVLVRGGVPRPDLLLGPGLDHGGRLGQLGHLIIHVCASLNLVCFPSCLCPVSCRCSSLHPGASGRCHLPQCSLQPHLCCCRAPRARGGAVVGGRGSGGGAKVLAIHHPHARLEQRHSKCIMRKRGVCCYHLSKEMIDDEAAVRM